MADYVPASEAGKAIICPWHGPQRGITCPVRPCPPPAEPERIVLRGGGPGPAGQEFLRALALVREGHSVVVEDGSGYGAVAAIIPAEDLHEPGQCCCKNCPWSNDHREQHT